MSLIAWRFVAPAFQHGNTFLHASQKVDKIESAVLSIEFNRHVSLVDIDNHNNKTNTFGIKTQLDPEEQGKEEASPEKPKRPAECYYWFAASSPEQRTEWFEAVSKTLEKAKVGSKLLKKEVVRVIEKGQLKELMQFVNSCQFHAEAKV